ncbi:MAG TPA: hypothetical protein VK465_19015 [Fibrobacteria bacterium]|nr:hypothetical protein [Fibrobacteria bacterium]
MRKLEIVLICAVVVSLAINGYFLASPMREIREEIDAFQNRYAGLNLHSKMGSNGSLTVQELNAEVDFFRVTYFIRSSGLDFLYKDFVQRTDSTFYRRQLAKQQVAQDRSVESD